MTDCLFSLASVVLRDVAADSASTINQMRLQKFQWLKKRITIPNKTWLQAAARHAIAFPQNARPFLPLRRAIHGYSRPPKEVRSSPIYALALIPLAQKEKKPTQSLHC